MRKKNGFTLIELLIVLSIIGIILTILIPNILIAIQNAKFREMRRTGVIENGYKFSKAIVQNNSTELVFLPELMTKAILVDGSTLVKNHLLRKGDSVEVLMRSTKKGHPRYNTVFFWRKLSQARFERNETGAESDRLDGAPHRNLYKAIIMSDDATIIRVAEADANIVVYPALIPELKLTVLVSTEELDRILHKGMEIRVSFSEKLNELLAAKELARIEALELR